MVDRQFITGFPLDNLSHFGELLMRKRRETGAKFVAWKSDIADIRKTVGLSLGVFGVFGKT
jgi:hypothetical protein